MTPKCLALVVGVVIKILSSTTVQAQIGIIQDSKGETSFDNFNSTVNLNFTSEEISGKVYKTLKNNEDKWSLITGLGLSLGATKGKTVLFKKGELNSKGSAEVSVAMKITNAKTNVDWYPIITAKFTSKSVNLWDSATVSISTVSPLNHEFQIGITRTTSSYPIISVAIKFGTTDNSSDLTSATFSTSTTSPTGTIQYDSKTAVGPANDFRKDLHNATFLADFLWIKGRVGIPLSFRLNFPDAPAKNNYLSIGTGIFVNKSTDAANQFVGGILLQDPDILQANDKSDILKRLTVSLVVGIPFGDAF